MSDKFLELEELANAASFGQNGFDIFTLNDVFDTQQYCIIDTDPEVGATIEYVNKEKGGDLISGTIVRKPGSIPLYGNFTSIKITDGGAIGYLKEIRK